MPTVFLAPDQSFNVSAVSQSLFDGLKNYYDVSQLDLSDDDKSRFASQAVAQLPLNSCVSSSKWPFLLIPYALAVAVAFLK